MFSGELVTNGHKYEIQGYDTSESFCFYITAHNYKDLAYMASSAEGYDEPDLLWERACEIKMTRITVQTGVSKNEAGKNVKSPVNADLFCRLAALIRYAKINCKASNAEGYSALELASGEFVAEPRKTYIIPYPVAQATNFARVTLDFGNIVSLHLEGGGFILNLKEDIGERLFVRPKDGWSSGFRLDSEYLGFEVPMRKVTVTGRNDGLFHTLEEIQEAHPEKDFSWLLEKDYQIVNDDTLEQTCQYLATEGKYLYFDTETTGLNINFLSRIGQADQCVGIILSVKYGESFFFPLQMNYISNLCNGDHFYVMEHYIRPLLEGRPVVVHNASFDWKVGYIYDINTNIVHDTMAIIALTLGAEIKNYSIGLKENTKILLGRDALELSDMIVDGDWGDNDIKFWDLPEELVRLYACADTDDTMGLLQYAEQNDILGRYGASRVYEIEVAFAVAVGYQEFYGHHINVANVDSLRETLYKEQKELMDKMVKMVGHDFNPNSSPQLLNIMYRELGIPEQISRKTGRPTTDKETLAKLAEITDAEDNVKYPFVKLLLEFRQYEGVRKIVDKFPEHMTPDGYIFSSVMQYGTTTGRVSINNPNYQSYNDPVKKNVVPRPGFYMTDTDYSSVEYRVLANMVGNEKIKAEFVDPDFDYHTYQAAHMYNVPYSAVTKKLRKAAKGINFGLPYGMGDESLGVRIFGEASEENTRKAFKLRAAYFKGQEDIRDWFEHHRDKGVNLGYTETYFGRRRYYRKSDFTVGAIRRQAGNQVVQGTAADIYKTAVGRVFKRICREGWLGKVLIPGFIHDELLCEVSNDINPGIFLKVLREEFEVKVFNDDGSPWCPLYMGFGYGMSWYEAKSVELPIQLQWKLVDQYGVDGFPNWDGDGRKFCDTIPDMLRAFEVEHITEQIQLPEAQGKEIKPALNSALLDCIKEDAKCYGEGLSEFMQEDFAEVNEIGIDEYINLNEGACQRYLDEHYHIQNVLRDDEGKVICEFNATKETQPALDLFCKLHKVDRSKVNLLDIEEAGEPSGLPDSDDDDKEEGGESYVGGAERLKDVRIDTLGMYLDPANKEVTFLYVPEPWIGFIQGKSNHEGKGYLIYFKDSLGIINKDVVGGVYKTKAYITSENVNSVQEMYLQYFKAGK